MKLFYLPPSFSMEAIIGVAENVVREMGVDVSEEELHRAITGFAQYVASIERHEAIKILRKCNSVEEAIDILKSRG